MNSDEHDELWHLLGKAKEIEPNPFLARNVLREIRSQQSSSSFSKRLRSIALRWKLSVAACTTAVLLLGIGAALNTPHLHKTSRGNHAPEAVAVQATPTNPDYEIIAHLDEMIALQENSLWTDAPQD